MQTVVKHISNGRTLGTWVCTHVKTKEYCAAYVYRAKSGVLRSIHPTFAKLVQED